MPYRWEMEQARPGRTLALLATTIALGLATRRFPGAFPEVVSRYGGDTLWAAMVLWIVVLVRPRLAVPRAALVALGLAYAVEVSQTYHAPWLDALRATRMGALALGQGFLWTDLVCYSAGVGLAAALEFALRAHVSRASTPASTRRA